MALASAVQGARHTAQRITWTDAEGDAQDLTGATLTGRRVRIPTGEAAAITGTLVVVAPATAGVFDWAYSAADVAAAGAYRVQFVATYGDGLNDKTLVEKWVVEPAI